METNAQSLLRSIQRRTDSHLRMVEMAEHGSKPRQSTALSLVIGALRCFMHEVTSTSELEERWLPDIVFRLALQEEIKIHWVCGAPAFQYGIRGDSHWECVACGERVLEDLAP